MQRIHPIVTLPVSSAGAPVAPGLYGLLVQDVGSIPRVVGLSAAVASGSSPVITYAQTGKTYIMARNATSGSTWSYVVWTVAHFAYLKVISFTWDVHTADTYTLSIDGQDVGSVVAGSGGGVAATLTLTTPKVLAKGPHTFKLRGTAARSFYYNSSNAPTPTGTYTGLTCSPWLGPSVTAQVPGTLTFDAEGTE